MNDQKTFGRLLLALYAREFERDEDVTTAYINESLFDGQADETGSSFDQMINLFY